MLSPKGSKSPLITEEALLLERIRESRGVYCFRIQFSGQGLTRKLLVNKKRFDSLRKGATFKISYNPQEIGGEYLKATLI